MADLVGEDVVAVDLRSGQTLSGSESAIALTFLSDLDSVFPDSVYPDKVLLADEVDCRSADQKMADLVGEDVVAVDLWSGQTLSGSESAIALTFFSDLDSVFPRRPDGNTLEHCGFSSHPRQEQPMRPLPTYFISHGGGPWPYMEDFRKAFAPLEASLVDIPRQLGTTPSAVLAVSGHWEAPEFRIMASPTPPMVYDYSGFPEHTYRVQYKAPGSPALARRVHALLTQAGLPASLDEQQGFDHGTFTPLVIMYPDAQVPVLQLSLRSGYDPQTHLAAGRALQALRAEGVLILGSGLSYHNMREMGPGAKSASKTFDDWLQETLVAAPPAERTRRLLEWSRAPAARQAHPREDHLIPLMVAVGAAESEPASCIYHQEDLLGGVVASSFRFGAVTT
jgi:aromatic ring-opening dioxygenase catalytic subunit (LigB family)